MEMLLIKNYHNHIDTKGCDAQNVTTGMEAAAQVQYTLEISAQLSVH